MMPDGAFPSDGPSSPGVPQWPDGRRPVLRAMRRTAMRWVRSLVLAAVVGMALVGALDTHWTAMLLFAPGLGASLAGVVALIDSDFPGEPASRRVVVYAFCTGVLLVPFSSGLVMLGTTGGTVLMGLLVLGPFLIGDWMAAAAGPAERMDVTALKELLPALATTQLRQQWRATEDLLRSPRHHVVAAEVRALLLDELSCRDPEGVAAWLAAGSDSPAAFIRSGRDLAG
jgi:hypothetical protein